MKRWFLVDAVSIVPFDIVAQALESGEFVQLKLLKIIRLFRLLKLARLLKTFRLYDKLSMNLEFSQRKITLVQLIGTVLLGSHWIGCVLGMTSRLQLHNDEMCMSKIDENCSVTWMTGIQAKDEQQTQLVEKYFLALHTAITVVVHPHDASTLCTPEVFVFMILTLVGGYLWTRIISRSTALSTSLEHHKLFYQTTMDDANAIGSELRLSKDLRRELRSYFSDAVDESQRRTWKRLTAEMSQQLRSATLREINWPWVRHVEYLANCSWSLITAVSEELQLQSYAQREFFGQNFHMYILRRGLASKSGGRFGCLLSRGAVWGTDHLLLNCQHLLEDIQALALTFVEVFVLSKMRWDSLIKDHPENEAEIRKKQVKVSVIRGIRYLARQAKERKKDWEEIVSNLQATFEAPLLTSRHARAPAADTEPEQAKEVEEEDKDQKSQAGRLLTQRPTMALGTVLSYTMKKMEMENIQEEGDESTVVSRSCESNVLGENHHQMAISDAASELQKLHAALKKVDCTIHNFNERIDRRIEEVSASMEAKVLSATSDTGDLVKDLRAHRLRTSVSFQRQSMLV